ncbi:Asp23/Gls24 family envelope stress response protein [Actinomycetospora sp. CA-084318]|uniref:Asp23/Gls24 family envelope stress response protein n=1 Tax=Actinomycetospora sp. CA-084318 TaxID=3239892 RepID=UPI003D956B33
MSTPASDATTPVPVVASPSVRADGDEAGERGRLDISFGVVRRIAEHAADSTEGTVRTERRVAGLGFGEAGASAKVSGYGDQVDVRLEVPLAYPAPIALTVDAVRGNVRERVQTLTGYAVRSLDVTVSALSVPAGPAAPTSRVQ